MLSKKGERMKYAVTSLALLTFIAACALDLLPDDQQKLNKMKTELKQCEDQVVALQKKIAEQREQIARESSAASVRAIETQERSGEPMTKRRPLKATTAS